MSGSIVRGIIAALVPLLLGTGIVGAWWSHDCGPPYFLTSLEAVGFFFGIFFAALGLGVVFLTTIRGNGPLAPWLVAAVLGVAVFIAGYGYSRHTVAPPLVDGAPPHNCSAPGG